MAAENRTDLASTLAALAAVVDLAELKAALTNFIDSMLMKRDVQNTVTVPGAGTTNVDFDGYDTIKVVAGYDCTLNIQNIVDGDVKFLWINRTSRVTIAFTGATSQDVDADYMPDVSEALYMVTKKMYGTVILVPLTTSFDHAELKTDIAALEARVLTYSVKTVAIGLWDMQTTGSVSIAHGLTLSKIRMWQVTIGNDAGTNKVDFEGAGAVAVGASTMTLIRASGGTFDSTDYNDGTIDRGTITIWYVD